MEIVKGRNNEGVSKPEPFFLGTVKVFEQKSFIDYLQQPVNFISVARNLKNSISRYALLLYRSFSKNEPQNIPASKSDLDFRFRSSFLRRSERFPKYGNPDYKVVSIWRDTVVQEVRYLFLEGTGIQRLNSIGTLKYSKMRKLRIYKDEIMKKYGRNWLK